MNAYGKDEIFLQKGQVLISNSSLFALDEQDRVRISNTWCLRLEQAEPYYKMIWKMLHASFPVCMCVYWYNCLDVYTP